MKIFYFKIIFIFAGILFLHSCSNAPQNGMNMNAPIPINIYPAHYEKAVYYDKFPGTVVGLMQVDVRAEAEGYVTGIFFKEGGHVYKGQKLYEIDRSKYDASKSQSEARLQVALANLDQAKKDADRYLYLNEHDAVAKQTLDHALTALQNAKNQVAAARQELVMTETDLNYSIVKAPFDGIIGFSQVKVGNSVVKGQTILNTISTINPMGVDFVINEKQIQRFNKLLQAKESDSVFSFLLPDNTVYNRMGKVLLMDRGVNPQTGTMTVRLVFQNDSDFLKSGMSGNVRVRNSDTGFQLLIPSKAIVEQMGEYFVFVARDTLIAEPKKENQKETAAKPPTLHAFMKKVNLGQTIADRVIVKSGLLDGDQVIIEGVQRLRDGSEVSLGTNQPKQH